jgi:uncharacterized protein (DUF1778 family)
MSRQREVKRNSTQSFRVKRDVPEGKTFSVDRETYNAFLARLDTPPAPNERLIRTLTTTPAWKR